MYEKIFIGLSVGIIVLILNLLSRKYIEPIMPDKKKAISYAKKFLAFNLKYCLNVYFLIDLTIKLEFNKSFVISTCFFFTIILFNLVIDYVNYINDKIVRIQDIHLNMTKDISTEIDRLNKKN